MRVVLDTNVLVSAFFWDGPERALLQACFDGAHELFTSVFILDELTRVLREKFHVPAEAVAEAIGLLLAVAEVLDPEPYLALIDDDPSDNRILECAIAARVDAIATGDSHLLDLGEVEGVVIRRAAEL